MIPQRFPGEIDRCFCHNKNCPDYGLRKKGNLWFCGWSGKNHKIRMVYCKTCRKQFSERKGTVLSESRLPEEKAISLLDHIREGCGTRVTGRLLHVSNDTVTRYILKAGDHARKAHDELVAFSPHTKEIQMDERWSFVEKKEKNVEKDVTPTTLNGDNWDHTAIDAESRLVLSIIPGKRTSENCVKLVEDVNKRTGGRTGVFITSDEHAPYVKAIVKVYGVPVTPPKRSGPGRPPNPRLEMPPDLCYATVKKTRKNGHVVKVTKTLVFGTWLLLAFYLICSLVSKTINTSFVERNNGTERGQNSRKARKTLAFSKLENLHNAASYFTGFSYNFCWPVRTLDQKSIEGKITHRTPAMAAGLTDHIWTIREWCMFPVPVG